jgi:hypothetical protein
MNREVHYDFTRLWALEAGFSEHDAETIAAACWNVDAIHSVREWRNKGYHFAWLGANRRARRLLVQAEANNDLVALGEALHCIQDAVGHGFWGHIVHWNGIDRWANRGPRVRNRIETRSRGALAAHRSSISHARVE